MMLYFHPTNSKNNTAHVIVNLFQEKTPATAKNAVKVVKVKMVKIDFGFVILLTIE